VPSSLPEAGVFPSGVKATAKAPPGLQKYSRFPIHRTVLSGVRLQQLDSVQSFHILQQGPTFIVGKIAVVSIFAFGLSEIRTTMTGVQVPGKMGLELKASVGSVADVFGIELTTSHGERLHALIIR